MTNYEYYKLNAFNTIYRMRDEWIKTASNNKGELLIDGVWVESNMNISAILTYPGKKLTREEIFMELI